MRPELGLLEGEKVRRPAIEAVTFHHAVSRVRKALFVYNMNLLKTRVRDETKERMRQELVAAAKVLGSWDDSPDYP
jgi:hypothetical protein